MHVAGGAVSLPSLFKSHHPGIRKAYYVVFLVLLSLQQISLASSSSSNISKFISCGFCLVLVIHNIMYIYKDGDYIHISACGCISITIHNKNNNNKSQRPVPDGTSFMHLNYTHIY